MRIYVFLFLLLPFFSHSQSTIDRIEPPFWWTGFQNSELQILLHGSDIGQLRVEVEHDNISLNRTVTTANPNYLFLYLNVEKGLPAGNIPIRLLDAESKVVHTIDYEFKAREAGAADREGYNNSDVLYLITPDRFANGDTTNDQLTGLREAHNRIDKWGRHGGDLAGITQRLDYLADMGFTAIWLNPVLENDQDKWSYHGYSTTDFYQVDPRFGSNADYRALAEVGRKKGIKVIMDMIMNHCGSEHWWMKDLPAKDWINNSGTYVQTNHRRTTLRDPYASDYDRQLFSDGWFVPTMPDLNQRNPLLATYLIQNTIWWIEYLGLAGIRMDTYPYSDKDFMRDWTCAVMAEYPSFNICGEEWSLNPAVLAYWQMGKDNPDGYTSCLPGLLDFPMQHALVQALTEPENWDSGMIKLYEMLSDDFLYADPFAHVIFPDNHDMSRIYTQLGEDDDLFRLAMVYFATMRGTPQFYYGTEILMSNTGDDSHGNIRSDFPGGWPGDVVDGFSSEGLSERQKSAQAFVRRLLSWRKTASAIHNGKLIHFVPQNGVYVYFRFNNEQTIMVILNKTDKEQSLELAPFREVLKNSKRAKDVTSGQSVLLDSELRIEGKRAMVLEVDN